MSTSYLGQWISIERLRRGWTFGDLARACGATTPKLTSRIAQRLVLFEREGVRDRRLLWKVISALDLDAVIIDQLLDRQREEEFAEWRAWISEPVKMTLYVLPFGGLRYRQPLPAEIADDELRAIEHAKELTRGREQLRAILAVSRRLSLVFAKGQLVDRLEAAPGRSIVPVVKIGKQLVQFEASA